MAQLSGNGASNTVSDLDKLYSSDDSTIYCHGPAQLVPRRRWPMATQGHAFALYGRRLLGEVPSAVHRERKQPQRPHLAGCSASTVPLPKLP